MNTLAEQLAALEQVRSLVTTLAEQHGLKESDFVSWIQYHWFRSDAVDSARDMLEEPGSEYQAEGKEFTVDREIEESLDASLDETTDFIEDFHRKIQAVGQKFDPNYNKPVLEETMSYEKIAVKELPPTPMHLEGSWGGAPQGTHASTMTFFAYEGGGAGFIEWDIPGLETTECIGLTWDEKKTLTDYDGVHCLPREAIEFLREHGITITSEVTGEDEDGPGEG